MQNRAETLARICEIILAWSDNENAPDTAANESQGQPSGKEIDKPFRSLPMIIQHDAAGEELSSETD